MKTSSTRKPRGERLAAQAALSAEGALKGDGQGAKKLLHPRGSAIRPGPTSGNSTGQGHRFKHSQLIEQAIEDLPTEPSAFDLLALLDVD